MASPRLHLLVHRLIFLLPASAFLIPPPALTDLVLLSMLYSSAIVFGQCLLCAFLLHWRIQPAQPAAPPETLLGDITVVTLGQCFSNGGVRPLVGAVRFQGGHQRQGRT